MRDSLTSLGVSELIQNEVFYQESRSKISLLELFLKINVEPFNIFYSEFYSQIWITF